MKLIITTFLILVLKTQLIAQIDTPLLIGVFMIGKSSKPILDLYIIDSTNKNDFEFDVHTTVLYANKNLLNSFYAIFENEKRADSLSRYDKSFGTFDFFFQFKDGNKVEVITNRIQSVALFKKIISRLLSENKDERLVIKEIEGNLSRINY